MLNQLSSILNTNDYRDLLTQFFAALSDEVPFISAELYLFPNNERKITTYRSIKERLYEKKFFYSDMNDTLIEEVFADKEYVKYFASDLFNKRSMIKNSYYFDEGAKMIEVYPLVNVSKLNGVMVLLFEDEVTNDIELYMEFLNAKLSLLYASEQAEKEKLYYKKILLNEKIYPYNTMDVNKELLNHHNNAEVSIKRVIKNDGKYYELTKIDDESGFMRDISNEIDLKIENAKAYKDHDTSLNTMNKLTQIINETDEYALLEIKFNSVYVLDVSKVLMDHFKRTQLFRSNESIYILFNTNDKRLLNKSLRIVKEALQTIMTFEYKVGVVRVPNDVKKNCVKMLKTVTNSDYDFYSKKVHTDVVNSLVIKKQIIDKISNDSYELKFHPIVNTKNQLEGYLVTHGIDSETIKDKRIELLMIQYTLRSILKVKKRAMFFIEVSDELVKSTEFSDVLKEFRNIKDFYKSISFIFDTVGTDSEKYLSKKESKISRRSIESLYKQEKQINYLFQSILYDDYSKEYIEFLSSLEYKGITPIFEVERKDDLQFVVDYGVGFVYTRMAQDVLIVKG